MYGYMHSGTREVWKEKKVSVPVVVRVDAKC